MGTKNAKNPKPPQTGPKKPKPLEVGEQLDLIDVSPANGKLIKSAARLYKKYQTERTEALAQEKKQKKKLLELVKEADLKPLDDGIIKFKCGGLMITLEPRDELIKVKEKEADM